MGWENQSAEFVEWYKKMYKLTDEQARERWDSISDQDKDTLLRRFTENENLAQAAPAAENVILRVLDRVALGGSSLVSLLSGLLASFLIIYSGFVLYDTFYTQENAGNAWELADLRPEIIDDGAVPLSNEDLVAKISEDYRAWFTIYDTTIDYPLMQGEDDLYYASHDIYGNSSLTGAIYLAAANAPDFSDNYNLVYGHHMDNRIMFGALDSYQNADFFESHRDAIVVTNDAVYDVTIFASISTNAYESLIYTVGDRDLDELYAYIEENAWQFDPSVLEGATKIIALSTCADATTSGRLVVFGVMTERDMNPEEPIPPIEETVVDDTPDDTPPDNPSVPGDDNPNDPNNPDNPNPNDNPDIPNNPDETGNPDDTAGPDDGTNPDDNVTNPDDVVTDHTCDEIDDVPDEPVVDIPDEPTPLDRLIARFTPTGDVHRGRSWALVNLLATIVTVYLFLPLLHLRAKYHRRKMMREVNDAKIELRKLEQLREDQKKEKDRIDQQAYEDRMTRAERKAARKNAQPIDMEADITEEEFDDAVEELYYRLKRFTRRSRSGYLAELITAVGAVVLFILTEDIRLPMVLIDKWTIFHLLIMALCWIIDVRLARYRSKAIEEEREELEEDIEKTKESIQS